MSDEIARGIYDALDDITKDWIWRNHAADERARIVKALRDEASRYRKGITRSEWEYEDDCGVYQQPHDTAIKFHVLRPTFCPDCGGRVILKGGSHD